MPVLFRDIGPVALETFLAGNLERLSGPYTPLLYMRTAKFREPFIDYAQTGRLVFLHARSLGPWHAGVAEVYVARAGRWPTTGTFGYVPYNIDFESVAQTGLRTMDDLREHLGATAYDQQCEHDRRALQRLNAEAAQAERWAHPLRLALQSCNTKRRQLARQRMSQANIDDQLLCAAWHHLPQSQRDHLMRTLSQLPPLPEER